VGLRPRSTAAPASRSAHERPELAVRAPYDKLTRVTAQILFDRLAYVDRLKAGSFTEQQARAAADALGEALVETVATKADIVQLDTKVETGLAGVKADILQLETKFVARFAGLEARIAESRASLIQWMVGVAIGACTIGAAAVSFIFKHMP
jgi:hypothetical protein